MTIEYEPVVKGVPESTPPLDRDRPFGTAPDGADHVYGDVPPATLKAWEYAAPMLPCGSDDAVVMARAPVIARLNCMLLVAALESLTCTVTKHEPAVVGVPEITPALDRDNPPGSAPDAMDQEYGGVPPVALRVNW
jgi:hypothetical protein